MESFAYRRYFFQGFVPIKSYKFKPGYQFQQKEVPHIPEPKDMLLFLQYGPFFLSHIWQSKK